MCSRFVLNHTSQTLMQWYETTCAPDIEAHFNIAPGSFIHAVRATASGRRIDKLRWGFIPAWANDPRSAPMLHNARCETIAEKPMFREALRCRRCLIPASGYYEWQSLAGTTFRKPFYLSMRDGAPLSFAAIWESVTGPNGNIFDTCTIVTTKANSLIETIHHRMPVLLDSDDWSAWLDAETKISMLLPLLRPYPAERMQAWEVDQAVERPLSDNPSLILPLDRGGMAQAAFL